MASETERVTIRIPAERLDALHRLVERGEFDTISDVVRAAIENFLDQHFAPEYISKLTIELPRGNVIRLEELVQKGDSVSIEDAIRNAVREYIRTRLAKAVEKIR